MALKRLLLIRAGETDWNLFGRWQGWVAAPLNEHGRQQAQRLANFIRHMGLSPLYSSDHRRARDTALILSEALGFPPHYDQRLRERHIGQWQGLSVPEIHGWYADEYEQLQHDPENYRIPGGESLADVRKRALAALDEILAAGEDREAALTFGVVTHTTTIRVILAALCPDFDTDAENFGNTSVSSLWRPDDTSWEIIAVNDYSHLDNLEARHMPEVQGDD